MKLLGLYFQEFNREYLSARPDRRRLVQVLGEAAAMAALFLATAVIMRGLS